jgi:hypothetical protein
MLERQQRCRRSSTERGEIVQGSPYVKAIFAVLVLAALAAQLGNIVWGT